MSLLYYISLRANAGHRGDVLFMSIQWIWFIILPLSLIESSVFNICIKSSYKPFIPIIPMLLVVLFNIKFYYREVNKAKILKRYTNKYKIIDDYPISCFFISYFSLISLGIFFL